MITEKMIDAAYAAIAAGYKTKKPYREALRDALEAADKAAWYEPAEGHSAPIEVPRLVVRSWQGFVGDKLVWLPWRDPTVTTMGFRADDETTRHRVRAMPAFPDDVP